MLGFSPVDWFLSSNSWRSLYTHPTITDPIKKTILLKRMWKKVLVTPNDGVSLSINILEMVMYQVPIRFLSAKKCLSYNTVWTKSFQRPNNFRAQLFVWPTYFGIWSPNWLTLHHCSFTTLHKLFEPETTLA